MQLQVLALNAGSSSLKCSLYAGAFSTVAPADAVWSRDIDWKSEAGHPERADRAAVIEALLREAQAKAATRSSGTGSSLEDRSSELIVAHRIVHGGSRFDGTVWADDAVYGELAQLNELAPLHMPAGLEVLRIARKVFPAPTRHAAVFDTAFHRTIPDHAKTYPIPLEWYDRGIKRYGFHGLSHQYCTQRAAELLVRPAAELELLSCHLGSGASIAAVRKGVSVDTTMGFSPLEGLMMGTRSGSIDPSIVIYLQRHARFDAEKIEQLLNSKSGLLGVSGVSADLRDLYSASGREGVEGAHAQLAIRMFAHSAAKAICGLAANLSRVDALIFTGGIGEHSSEMRTEICKNLRVLQSDVEQNVEDSTIGNGLLDADLNRTLRTDGLISPPAAKLKILRIETQEQWQMARECWVLAQTPQCCA